MSNPDHKAALDYCQHGTMTKAQYRTLAAAYIDLREKVKDVVRRDETIEVWAVHIRVLRKILEEK